MVNNPTDWFGGAIWYRGAYMEYTESGNELELDSEGQMKTFPVRDGALHLNDVNFKLEEAIAYEASRGMVPDYAHELNELSGNSNYKYNTLIFKQKNEDTRDGQLALVIYEFNRPGGSKDPADGSLRLEYSTDERLAGTVAKRQDIYEGNKYSYKVTKEPYSGWERYSMNYRMEPPARNKGYRLFRTDNIFTTFVRGKKDFVDVQTYSTRTKFIFYESEELMKLISNL